MLKYWHKVHGAFTQSFLLVLTTVNVSTTLIRPVISRLYISDILAATLPNASRIFPKRSGMIYKVRSYLNTNKYGFYVDSSNLWLDSKHSSIYRHKWVNFIWYICKHCTVKSLQSCHSKKLFWLCKYYNEQCKCIALFFRQTFEHLKFYYCIKSSAARY